jgi:hypothetical protein
MGWNCEACTFLNSINSSNKCEICETPRSDADVLDVWNDDRKPRCTERKPVVQATLFGGVVPIEERKEKSKKRKPARPIDSDGKSIKQSAVLFSFKRPSHDFVISKQCSDRNVPYSELKERMHIAMRTVFGVEKLRFLQPKAVKCALMRTSQLVVMATGGGLYQSLDTFLSCPTTSSFSLI